MASGNPTQIHRLTVLQSPEEKEHNNENNSIRATKNSIDVQSNKDNEIMIQRNEGDLPILAPTEAKPTKGDKYNKNNESNKIDLSEPPVEAKPKSYRQNPDRVEEKNTRGDKNLTLLVFRYL